MEKKNYNKPEVNSTKIDFSITLTQASPNGATPNGAPVEVPVNPPNESSVVNVFINPFKWFK